MRFYADGRKERDFESGIAAALEAILASPQFLFRVETASAARTAASAATAESSSPTGASQRHRAGLAAVVLPLGRRRPTPS